MRPIDADFLTDCFKSSLDTDETLFNEVMKKIIGVLEATPSIKTKEIKYYDDDEQVWRIGRVIVDEGHN